MKLQRTKAIHEDNAFDRLRDLDVESFDRDSCSIGSADTVDGGKNFLKNRKKRDQIPFMNDTLSEINDEKEKNAIFNHSMRHGLFNDIRNSPLKKKMPNDLQFYNPALEKRLFSRDAPISSGLGQR